MEKLEKQNLSLRSVSGTINKGTYVTVPIEEALYSMISVD